PLRRAASPVQRGAPRGRAAARSGPQARASRAGGRRAEPDEPARGLPLPHALSARARPLPSRVAAAAGSAAHAMGGLPLETARRDLNLEGVSMRIFSATIATETNTFSPLPTSIEAFKDSVFLRPGEHPNDAPRMCTAPLFVARRRAARDGFTLI